MLLQMMMLLMMMTMMMCACNATNDARQRLSVLIQTVKLAVSWVAVAPIAPNILCFLLIRRGLVPGSANMSSFRVNEAVYGLAVGAHTHTYSRADCNVRC